VARLIGGGDFDYTSAGDVKASIAKPASGHAGRRATPGAQPLTDSLRAEYLALPANVLDILTPPPPATAAPRILCHPHGLGVRCFRLPKRAPRKPPASCWTPAASTAWHGSMRATATAGRAGAGQLLQKPGSATRAGLRHRRRSGATGANWVVASLLNLLDGGKLHPQVTAEVRQSMRAGAMAAKNPGKGVTADSRKQAADRIPPTWPMNAASSCVHYPLCHQARRYEKAQSC
jgi:hypothetical protein